MAQKTSFWCTSRGLASLALIGAASYFLFMEHREHLTQWLPFLILLLCPLMHLFMHGGHHHKHQKQVTDTAAYRKGYEAGHKDQDKQDEE